MRTIVLALALSAAAAHAQSTALFMPKVINLQPSEVEALGQVCTSEYQKALGQPVIPPWKANQAIGPNGSLTEAAQALGATELVELTVVGLGHQRHQGSLLLSADRRSLEGTELAHAEIGADSLEDTVPACTRLARALVGRLSVEQTADRGTVTAFEARHSRKPNRTGSDHLLGIKTAFAVPVSGRGELNPLGYLGFNARLEFARWFLELGVGALVPAVVNSGNASYGGIATELGGSYYLTDGETSVYLGGGLQPRVLFSGSIVNFAPYAQLGVMFMRSSSTRLYADVRVSQNLLPITGYSSTGSTQLWPTELGLQVGIGW